MRENSTRHCPLLGPGLAAPQVEDTLTHELVHAYDHCRFSMRVPMVRPSRQSADLTQLGTGSPRGIEGGLTASARCRGSSLQVPHS